MENAQSKVEALIQKESEYSALRLEVLNDVYNEGWKAFIDGDDYNSNPYKHQNIPVSIPVVHQWNLGWCDACNDLVSPL